MPIHDWTRVDAGLFHDFHQVWTVALRSALNAGTLPPDYFALVEQRVPGPIADVLTLQLKANGPVDPEGQQGGLAVATAPPRTQLSLRGEAEIYAGRANRITVRHRHGHVVAVIEVVSPGNKASQTALHAFVRKSAELLHQGVHLLVIDLFPCGPRDPNGIHRAIWDELGEYDPTVPPDASRTVASYESDQAPGAYVDFVRVSDPLPDAPLFLRPGIYVPAPLEASYSAAWKEVPVPLRGLLTDEH